MSNHHQILSSKALPEDSTSPLEERRRVQRELTGLCDLGLFEEARHCAEEFLTRAECELVRGRAMHIAARQMDFAAAARHADVLLAGPRPVPEFLLESIPVFFHYAGRHEEAYEMTRNRAEQANGASMATWYNLACYALPAGRHEESLQALLKCFALGDHPRWQPWTKAFLDSELGPLWDYVGGRTCSLRDAVEWARYPLEAVLAKNADPTTPRLLDFDDMARLPRRFHGLLSPKDSNTSEVNWRKARRHPRVLRGFLEWQQAISRPRVQVFADLIQRVREIYDRHVPDMVNFSLRHNRLGTARFILRQYLLRKPETDPASLPEFPGLEYWTEEWRELREVSPEGLHVLLNSRDLKALLALRHGFDDLPERLRESGLGWISYGNVLFFAEEIERALGAFLRAAKFWPCDDSVFVNIIICLMRLGRREEAMEVSNHPCLLAWPTREREYLLQAILDGKTRVAPTCRQNWHFPTPSVNDLDDRTDREFLLTNQKDNIVN